MYRAAADNRGRDRFLPRFDAGVQATDVDILFAR